MTWCASNAFSRSKPAEKSGCLVENQPLFQIQTQDTVGHQEVVVVGQLPTADFFSRMARVK